MSYHPWREMAPKPRQLELVRQCKKCLCERAISAFRKRSDGYGRIWSCDTCETARKAEYARRNRDRCNALQRDRYRDGRYRATARARYRRKKGLPLTDPPRRFLTTTQAGIALEMSAEMVRYYIAKGAIKAVVGVRPGGKGWYIDPAEIERFRRARGE